MNKKEFFNKISSDWEKEHSTRSEGERTCQFVQNFGLKPGDRVLDLGCGTGRLIPFIKNKVGSRGLVVGLDFSQNMLNIARQKYSHRHLHFIRGDAHYTSLGDQLFSVVICMALFPHLDDKNSALKEFKRVLKPGGQLIISHQMSREELNRFHQEIKGPVTCDLLPDHQEMVELLRSARYKNISISDQSGLYIARAFT
ncbi:MAG: class I SAM-dependent methyltransferase [Candidatus Aminicenantes bacterium]|nr:class I SAM-dependent methyltransferase [Candidatus Aminicenantes bacterium]